MLEEIEDAMRNGAHPLFLHGLVSLAEKGHGSKLAKMIDYVGQRLYLKNGDDHGMEIK
jgi:hypothetical protein